MATHGLDLTDPLDRLALEAVPIRITPPDPYACADGPTVRYAALLRQQELWAAEKAAKAVTVVVVKREAS